MPVLTYSNSAFVTLTRISSSVMNAYFTDITTWANTTKLDYLNIQDGGLRTANYQDNSVTAAKIGTASAASGSALVSSGASTPVWNIITQQDSLYNLGLGGSASGGALTLSLTQASGSAATTASPVVVGLRNSTLTTGTPVIRNITGSLTQTITSTTTLGMLASQNNYLWIYAIDSNGSGTMKLGASTVRFDDTTVQSTVAESFTGTVTIASPGVWTATAHGLNNADAVTLTTTGALPTGLTAGTTYYVVSTATNTFQLATTPGGSAINTTGSQSGIHTIRVANSRIVSDAAYSVVSVRLIGRMTFNLSVSGTWLTPTEIALANGNLLPESIMARYRSSTTTVGTGDTTIVYPTRTYDTHNGYNTTTGTYYVQQAGKYRVTAACIGPALNWTAGSSFNGYVYKNGTVDHSLYIIYAQTTYSSNRLAGNGSATINCAYGDAITIRMAQVSSAAIDVTTTATNYFTIEYLGA